MPSKIQLAAASSRVETKPISDDVVFGPDHTEIIVLGIQVSP